MWVETVVIEAELQTYTIHSLRIAKLPKDYMVSGTVVNKAN